MSAPNRNALWARAIAQELARSGVRHACVSPGNRSGPLAFAFAEQANLKVWTHIDERSGGFFALGLARAARAPVALLCTTGTAAANFLPAVVEANHARVPLVVLTADRPPDLRDTGANQAIDQVGIYGKQVRWALDLPAPAAEDRALRHLRAMVSRAVAAARGAPPGPVHLNVPLPKPLEPTPVPGDVPADFAARFPLAAEGRPDGGAYASVAAAPREASPAQVAGLARQLDGRRGLIVVGPQESEGLPEAVLELAMVTGFPVLADALSGLRFGPAGRHVLGAYDAFLQVPEARAALAPEVVVRLGAAPTSDALLQFLEATRAPQVVLDDDPDWRDPLHLPAERLLADPARAAQALAGAVKRPAEQAWAQRWRRLDRAAQEAQEPLLRTTLSEAGALAAALDAAPEHATVFVSNSLPVRDLDRFGAPRGKALRARGNRGASGIDGITSTALGLAAGGEEVLLLTGDLAFLHDLPGLLAFRRLGVAATVVVLNNNGGRIFEQLPAAAFEPPFRELFVTPHGLDLEPAARLAGAAFARATEPAAFGEALARALKAGGPQVVEARVAPEASRAHRAQLAEAVAGAVRGSGLAR